MLKGSGENSVNQDPHVMEVAHSLVNDVIEKAREEVMKRKVSNADLSSVVTLTRKTRSTANPKGSRRPNR